MTIVYVLLAIFAALSVVDLLQSLKLQRRPNIVENNPILGPHSAPGKLIAFGLLSTALWCGAALFLAAQGAPQLAVLLVLGVGIALRGYTVIKNARLGGGK